jgi:transposase
MPEYQRAQATPKEAEVRQLRAEIKRLEMENEILKKASAFFARNQRRSPVSSLSISTSTR